MPEFFFILGADDPEMALIRRTLDIAHIPHVGAMCDGKPVHPGNAYRADMPAGLIDDGAVPIIAVECQIAGITPSHTIDHHRPGDAGYGLPPEHYWRGSSIGQVWEFLLNGPFGGGMDLAKKLEPLVWEARIAAAADHCLGHAYAGRCPGVDPAALRLWRTISRAEYQDITPREIMARQDAAIAAIAALPMAEIGRFDVADARGVEIPELPEASAITGEPVMYSLDDKRSGREKVGLLGADRDYVVSAWMEWARTDGGLADVYGDPARGFAGGYV